MNNSSFAFASAEEEILTAAKETKANLIVRGAKAPKNLTGHAPLTIAQNVVARRLARSRRYRADFFGKGATPRNPHRPRIKADGVRVTPTGN